MTTKASLLLYKTTNKPNRIHKQLLRWETTNQIQAFLAFELKPGLEGSGARETSGLE
jgi:hypothetical protein